MIVLTVTDCPPKLRGDLSKWLCEINTGVYVGRVSARVREELWKRVCEHVASGRATMVFSAANEQRMSFYVHNTTWEPVDFDGLTLMRRPTPQSRPADGQDQHHPQSKAEAMRQVQRIQAARARKQHEAGYVVVDVETTGLDSATAEIIELAAIRVVDHAVAAQMTCLVRPHQPLPESIAALTGITPDQLRAQGVSLKEGLTAFLDFLGERPMVSHNIGFDRAFLRAACEREGLPPLRNLCKDTLMLSRRLVEGVANHKLSTLAAHFNIDVTEQHRALADCLTTWQLYEKLNEI